MLFAALFLIVAPVVLATSKPSPKPTVYFIRHGEKPADGDGLAVDGLRRAECLRNVFAANSTYNIGHIIAQTPQPDGRQKRPYDTVRPLGKDLGIEIDTSCQRDDVPCVKKIIKHYSGAGNILVCWEHRTMTNITEALGDKNPPYYPSDDYHHIWTDPWPYIHVNDEPTSQNCAGLDDRGRLGTGAKVLIGVLIAAVIVAVIATGYIIFTLTRGSDSDYEPIE